MFLVIKIVDPDLDPHWPKIVDPDLDPHWPKMLDPDLHRNQCGSTTLLLWIVDHVENVRMPSNIVLQLVRFSFCWNKYFKQFADILCASWIVSSVFWLLQIVLQCEDFSFWWDKYFLQFVVFLSPNKYFKQFSNVADTWHFGTDSDSDLWIRTSD